MNYGLMPNPQKELTVNFSFEQVKKAILKIPELHPTEYKLDRDDTTLNQIRFTNRWGVTWNGFALFSLIRIDDDNTRITIETGDGRRGSINSNIEANNANNDLTTLQNYLSDYLSNNVDEKGMAKSKKVVQPGCVFIILAGIGISLLYFLL